jgi:uncharacterized protein YbaR (Trm112 family)
MQDEHWIEILKCPRCGNTGLAELSENDAYEGHENLVPAGFKAVYRRHGVAFYCVGCEVLATSERR